MPARWVPTYLGKVPTYLIDGICENLVQRYGTRTGTGTYHKAGTVG